MLVSGRICGQLVARAQLMSSAVTMTASQQPLVAEGSIHQFITARTHFIFLCYLSYPPIHRAHGHPNMLCAQDPLGYTGV